MQTVIWFNSKRILDEQVAEIRRSHGNDTVVVDASGLARVDCATEKDLRRISGELCELAWVTQAVAVYGYFDPPILGAMYELEMEAKQSGGSLVPCFVIWGYSSTNPEGKRQWNHKRFCRISGGIVRRI